MSNSAENIRLDQFLVNLGRFASRARARDAVARGTVTVNGKVVTKPAHLVSDADKIEVDDPARDYVSRSALKLKAALDHFGIDPEGSHCLDIGASTGGFTEILLERNALHVTSIDVGHAQMHERIAEDERVTNIEGLNARELTEDDIEFLDEQEVDLVVADVSFISLKLALPPALEIASPGSHCALLVKPQFEAGRDFVGKGGLLKDPTTAPAVAAELERWLVEDMGWESLGLIPSPITGGDGNVEFLLGGRKP